MTIMTTMNAFGRARWIPWLASIATLTMVAPTLGADSFQEQIETGRARCASPAARDRSLGDGLRLPPGPPVVAIQNEDDVRVLQWIGVAVDSISAPIAFNVRQGVVGLMIRAELTSDDYDVEVQLFDADGEQLNCETCPDAPVVGEIRAGRGATQVPNTDRDGWELDPGQYSFRVRATPKKAVAAIGQFANVMATMRRDVAVDVDHVLDLNFIYLPGCNVTVASATTDPHFDVFLDRLASWIEPIGIRIGEVTHHDLDREEFRDIATWEEAGAMFRTSAGLGRSRALNVYCIQQFVAPLSPVIGLSGGIPGPSWNGTRDSGVAMTTQSLFSCADCVDAYAALLSHEIGHYLGLYHTTEADYMAEDPFSDTPVCTKKESGDDLGQCPDREYVMFPVLSERNFMWSPGQVTVVRTHPIVRTVATIAPNTATAAPLARALGNPFRDRLSFVATESQARLTGEVFDVRGQRVLDLAAGTPELRWDGRDAAGASAPAGVYFVRVSDGLRAETHRVVKLR